MSEYIELAGQSAKIAVAIRTSRNAVLSSVDPPPPVQGSIRVLYNITLGNTGQQQTESRNDFRCPWCNLNCLNLYSLTKHLKNSHTGFLIRYSV